MTIDLLQKVQYIVRTRPLFTLQIDQLSWQIFEMLKDPNNHMSNLFKWLTELLIGSVCIRIEYDDTTLSCCCNDTNNNNMDTSRCWSRSWILFAI